MAESTIMFLILVTVALLLLGVKTPGKVLSIVLLAWLIWEIFFLREPRHAGNTVQQGLHDLIEFFKSVTT